MTKEVRRLLDELKPLSKELNRLRDEVRGEVIKRAYNAHFDVIIKMFEAANG